VPTLLNRLYIVSNSNTSTHRFLVTLSERFLGTRFGVVRSTSLSAEPSWAPTDGSKWEERDFEGELKKLEAEAEDRLDKKIAEMMSNIESVGTK